jgi:hypothetical protein
MSPTSSRNRDLRGEVRVGHDHLMAKLLQAPRNPFALRRRLDQHSRLRPLSQHRCKSLSIRLDPPFLEDLCVLPDHADLAIHLVHVDAYTLHGWPPSPCGFDRVLDCGAFQLPRWSGGQPLHPIYPLNPYAWCPAGSRERRWQLNPSATAPLWHLSASIRPLGRTRPSPPATRPRPRLKPTYPVESCFQPITFTTVCEWKPAFT